MADEELVALTATEAAAELARGAISSAQYSRACLDRIEATGGEIKAFAARARLADQRINDQAGGLLRRVCGQADPWLGFARGCLGAFAQTGSYWRLRALASRSRAYPGSDRRSRSGRSGQRAFRRPRFPRA